MRRVILLCGKRFLLEFRGLSLGDFAAGGAFLSCNIDCVLRNNCATAQAGLSSIQLTRFAGKSLAEDG
jgi:hypothetical protein